MRSGLSKSESNVLQKHSSNVQITHYTKSSLKCVS
eukprot:UN04615